MPPIATQTSGALMRSYRPVDVRPLARLTEVVRKRRTRRRSLRRRAPRPRWLALIGLLTLASCASTAPRPVEPPEPEPDGEAVALIDEVLFAFPGRTFVAPIGVRGTRPAIPEVRLITGERLNCELVWYRGRPAPPSATQSPKHHWLLPGLTWTAETRRPAAGVTDEAGFWALLIDIPLDTKVQVVLIDGRRAPIRWLKEPGAGEAPEMERASALERLTPDLIERLRPLAQDPTRRWRLALLSDRLAFDLDELLALLQVEPDPPHIAFLSTQIIDQWRAGIARLRAQNPSLADATLRALTLIIEAPNGELLPAWRPTDPLRRQFLAALLDPARSEFERAGWARSWLESQPQVATWTVDDAGATGVGQESVVRLGVSNMTQADVVAQLLRSDGWRGPRSMVRAEASALVIARPRPDALSERMELRFGDQSRAADFLSGAIPLRPPGLAIGPLLEAWTLASWLVDEPAPTAHADTCAALLHFSPDETTLRLFIEAKTGDHPSETPRRDEVVIWLGPTGAGAEPLVVRSDGALFRGIRTREPIGVVDVTTEEDRWSALVDVPLNLISADGDLLLGLTRTDAHGQRSSWPRPLMPGQVEPGRARIDCGAWARSREIDQSN